MHHYLCINAKVNGNFEDLKLLKEFGLVIYKRGTQPDNPDFKGCLLVEAKRNSYTLNPQPEPWMLPCRLWRGFPPLDQH